VEAQRLLWLGRCTPLSSGHCTPLPSGHLTPLSSGHLTPLSSSPPLALASPLALISSPCPHLPCPISDPCFHLSPRPPRAPCPCVRPSDCDRASGQGLGEHHEPSCAGLPVGALLPGVPRPAQYALSSCVSSCTPALCTRMCCCCRDPCPSGVLPSLRGAGMCCCRRVRCCC
jgi:hypothetical protein